MSGILEKTYTEFVTKKDVASFIKFFSVITWQKIGFVWEKYGLKFHEVTATQNLLFQFRILSEAFPNSVAMFEAVAEKTNGNDIELFIKMEDGYVFFACQAKIAHKGKNGIYTSIEHPGKSKKIKLAEQQINSLLKYAKDKHGIPIYLFYNFSNNIKAKSAITNLTPDDIAVYGCTFLDARMLIGSTYFDGTNWIKKPSFSLLHPKIGKPFYTLFNLLGQPKTELVPTVYSPDYRDKAILDSVFEDLTNYVRPRLDDRDSNYWIPITEGLTDDQTKVNTDRGSTRNDNTEGGFNPKYRIVINNSEIDTSIAKWLFM